MTAAAAPYKRLRLSDHGHPAGTFTADILGCGWSCAGCWSRHGGRDTPASFLLTGEQVAARLADGIGRHGLTMARITYGEPTEHWQHLSDAIGTFLRCTTAPLGLIIETNGALLTPDRVEDLAGACGQAAGRVIFDVGIKATSGPRLAALTGHPRDVAERLHHAQLLAIMTLAHTNLGLRVTFLDAFSSPPVVAAVAHELEQARPGSSAGVRVVDHDPR